MFKQKESSCKRRSSTVSHDLFRQYFRYYMQGVKLVVAFKGSSKKFTYIKKLLE